MPLTPQQRRKQAPRKGSLHLLVCCCVLPLVLLLVVAGPARAEVSGRGSEAGAPLCDTSGGALLGFETQVSEPVTRAEAQRLVPPADEPGCASGAMCDPDGASIVARPEVPSAKGGTVTELPCDGWLFMTGFVLSSAGLDAHGRALRAADGQFPWRALELDARSLDGLEPPAQRRPRRAAASRVHSFTTSDLGPQAGFRREVYRPPLAGASRFAAAAS